MNTTLVDTGWYAIGVHSYYVMFGVTSIPLCILLLFLIITKSPVSFLDYKIVLFNTTINSLLLAVVAVFFQGRALPTATTYAILPIGPCRLVSPEACFVSYNLYNAFTVSGVFATAMGMHFRYSLLKMSIVPRQQLVRNMVLFNIIPVSMMITPHLASFEFEKVMSSAIAAYPEYDLLSYGPFGGFKSVQDPIFQFNTLILIVAAYSFPIIILYWRRKIVTKLNNNTNNLSPKTLRSSRMLVKALTYQTFLPVVCYIPNITHYVLVSIYAYRIQITEYMPTMTTGLPCIMDPILTIYFVAPYRTWVSQNILGMKKKIVPSPTVPTVSLRPSQSASNY